MVRAREGDAKTRARRLVHLAEHHRHLVEHVRLLAGRVDVLGLLHFPPEVVAFAGALADAGEHGVAAEVAGDAGDHLLDDDGLADACAAEEADLAAADEGAQEVDDLDAGLEDFGLGVEVGELGGLGGGSGGVLARSTGPRLSIGLPSRLKTRPRTASPTGTVTGRAGVDAGHAAAEAVGGAQRDRTDLSAAKVLLRPRRSGRVARRVVRVVSILTAL